MKSPVAAEPNAVKTISPLKKSWVSCQAEASGGRRRRGPRAIGTIEVENKPRVMGDLQMM